jgi:PRTRC genetic system ThiF family protein
MKKNFLNSEPLVRLHVPDFKRVSVTLVGCGGTGSHIASGLVALQAALADQNILLDALMIDGDKVEPKNVGRQLFAIGDIGKPKSVVIADRLNAAFGCRFGSLDLHLEDSYTIPYSKDALDIVIGAVDNVYARQCIAASVAAAHGILWWLDCGNENHSGQVALGNVVAKAMRVDALGMTDRLPMPSVVYPDLIKSPRKARAPRSCAEAIASGEQSLMVNRVVAGYACELLHAFLVERDPKWFALAFDLRFGGVKPYALDLATLGEVTGLKRDQLVEKGKKK